MTETKLALEQGALTLSNAQVCFKTSNSFAVCDCKNHFNLVIDGLLSWTISSDVKFRLSDCKILHFLRS